MLGLAVTSARADKAIPRGDFVKRVESCEAILREFMERPATKIPDEVWQRAKGLVIVNQFKAGVVLGVKDGYGVVMVKKPNGKWSLPVLVNVGEASLGLQLGGTAVETVYVLMDDVTPKLLFNERMNVGVDAKAVAGPRAADSEKLTKDLLATPMLVYSHKKGLFAGATVKAGYIARNDEANRAFYETDYSLPELLYSDWVNPPQEVTYLIDFVQKLSP